MVVGSYEYMLSCWPFGQFNLGSTNTPRWERPYQVEAEAILPHGPSSNQLAYAACLRGYEALLRPEV